MPSVVSEARANRLFGTPSVISRASTAFHARLGKTGIVARRDLHAGAGDLESFGALHFRIRRSVIDDMQSSIRQPDAVIREEGDINRRGAEH